MNESVRKTDEFDLSIGDIVEVMADGSEVPQSLVGTPTFEIDDSTVVELVPVDSQCTLRSKSVGTARVTVRAMVTSSIGNREVVETLDVEVTESDEGGGGTGEGGELRMQLIVGSHRTQTAPSVTE